jgi:hypothetical protein
MPSEAVPYQHSKVLQKNKQDSGKNNGSCMVTIPNPEYYHAAFQFFLGSLK